MDSLLLANLLNFVHKCITQRLLHWTSKMSTATTTVPPQSSTGIINSSGAPEYSVISYAKLLKGETDEVASLRKACEREGFFYLDLRQDVKQPHPVEQDVPSVFKAVNEFFKLDDEEKIQYDIDTIAPWKLHGYVISPMSGDSVLSVLILYADTHHLEETQD